LIEMIARYAEGAPEPARLCRCIIATERPGAAALLQWSERNNLRVFERAVRIDPADHSLNTNISRHQAGELDDRSHRHGMAG